MRMGFVAAAFAALLCSQAQAAGGYSDWAAIVVAGDYRAHDGTPAAIFDNARRDISAQLQRIGFKKDNVLQFAVQPELFTPPPSRSDTQTIANSLWDLSNSTSGGCFVYITSHGSPEGVAIGDTMTGPKALSAMLNNACGDRPTVAIISACYSGVFVPALAGPNRLVLTAARGDRTSFGCGQTYKYTFFDECVLQEFPASHDFPGLATLVQGCVAAREKKENMAPPSEPQLSVGANVAAALPRW